MRGVVVLLCHVGFLIFRAWRVSTSFAMRVSMENNSPRRNATTLFSYLFDLFLAIGVSIASFYSLRNTIFNFCVSPATKILHRNSTLHFQPNQNKTYPQQLIHKTSTGEYVRSKSEAFILTYLHMNHIPFRYECELQLGTAFFYPDFTIRHPKTGEMYYWEHFGMMDNREYAKKNYAKLETYQAYGIIPSINLITTFETQDHPLSLEVIEKLIKHYFL